MWSAVVEHYGIAIAMALGSYVAGATPMGGGTVGFPILVLLFNEPATLGRDFSFAVQSIGMTSASLFILSHRKPVEWPMLRWALLGTLVGTPLGVLFLAPYVPGLWIKAVFAVVWASFGVLHLHRLREFVRYHGPAPASHRFDRKAGLAVGFFAGLTVASVTGVGIDMVIYCVLVLLCHADLKIAIPTSVVLMAATSLIGAGTKFATTGFQPGVYENWLAAAPVVALGAPLGAYVVDKIGRAVTLYCVSILCLGQFIWTVYAEANSLGSVGIGACVAGVLVFLIFFQWLYSKGRQLDRRGYEATPQPHTT